MLKAKAIFFQAAATTCDVLTVLLEQI